MPRTLKHSSLLALLLTAACTTLPSGPGVLVLPGTGKNFDQFREDDGACRQFAHAQVGGKTPKESVDESVARSAVLGTAVGAVAGAAINGPQGAAAGAGTGLVVGGLAGASAGETSAQGLQQRYDFSYQQCMYANGHRIPISGRFAKSNHAAAPPPPPPPNSAPPR